MTPRTPLLALLLAALALLAAGCSARTMNGVLGSHADNAGPGEVNSADNGASIPIGSGKRVVLFNDAFVGALEPDLERPPGTPLVNNALVVWDADDNTKNTYIGAGPSAQFKPADPDHFYWLTNGVKDGTWLRLLAQERVKPTATSSAFPLVANVVISVPLSNLDATPTVTRLPIAGDEVIWGEGIVAWEGHWYVYGAVQDGFAHRTLLARAPLASLQTLSSWRYYQPSDGTWSTSQGAAGALLNAAGGGHVPHLLHPVVHDGRVVSLASSSVFDSAFRWASSATPWGVVTVGPNAFAPPEAGQACGTGGAQRIVYSVHPHDQSDPAESLWSYSTTCWAARRGSTAGSFAPDYRPRFFNLDLADAPAPCPALTEPATRSFVAAAYTEMARRAPSSTESDYWTTEIATKGHCRSRLVTQLALDGGFLGGLVDDAYAATLDRAPSAAARASRVSQILGGASIVDQWAALLASDEFRTAAGGSDSAFVTRLYERVLGFTPSAGDLSYWVARTGSVGREAVAREIYRSADSRSRRVNALAVRHLGRRFAGSELDYWRTRIGEGSNDDVTVTRDLLSTAEYLTRAQTLY